MSAQGKRRDLSTGWTLEGARPATAPEALLNPPFNDGTTDPPAPATSVDPDPAAEPAGEEKTKTPVDDVTPLATNDLVSYSARYERRSITVLRWWCAMNRKSVQKVVNEAVAAHLRKLGAFTAYDRAHGIETPARRTRKASA